MTKFWLQTKAPAGNWVDSLGSDDIEDCKSHGRHLHDKEKREVRVVERIDIPWWRPEGRQEG